MKKSTLIFGLIGIVCGFLLMMLSRNEPAKAVFGLIIAIVSGVGMVIRQVFSKYF